MAEEKTSTPEYATLRRRLFFLFAYGVALYGVAAIAIGSPKPSGGGEWLWWMSAVCLYTVSTLSAPFFVRPRDSLANALACAPMLFTVDLSRVPSLGSALETFRWAALGFVTLTGALAIVAIALQGASRQDVTWRGRLSRFTYRCATLFGNEAVIFTPPALISIIGFQQSRPQSILWLAAVWVFIVTVKPVEMLSRIWDLFKHDDTSAPARALVGRVTRVDDPNIIRVSLVSSASWTPDRLHAAHLAGNRHVDVVPLFVQTQDDQLVGTGLCSDGNVRQPIAPTEVWTSDGDGDCAQVIERLAGNAAADLVGFVVEESTIASIKFEMVGASPLFEGAVVSVRDADGTTIYYQVLDAVTKEEVFTQNPRGTRVVSAAQLGTLSAAGRFSKYGWVPSMNAPVFWPKDLATAAEVENAADEFLLGTIPQSNLSVKAGLADMMRYHTAVLGVTGTGKTELVLDLVRAHRAAGRKVLCVDFTGEYRPRLADCQPIELGFDQPALAQLDELVNATEYGKFGGAEEKEALSEWVAQHHPAVVTQVETFMRDDATAIGVFELPDIANTRATLRATEMYLSAVFAWARQNRRAKEIVVVLEEAHTIVPETSLYRYDKADTDAAVGRMSQIALQGRKYGVGLLLVSQRTALVSKTLLSQCNTCICFAMYDKTGLEYLETVFASAHARAIPNLAFLQGIAFGKAIKSDRPVIFEIAFSGEKKQASETLDAVPTGEPARPIAQVPAAVPVVDEPILLEPDDDDIPF